MVCLRLGMDYPTKKRGLIAPFFISLDSNISSYEPPLPRIQTDHHESNSIQVFCFPKALLRFLGRTFHRSFRRKILWSTRETFVV